MIRILIADDDLIARLLLSEILSEHGACDAVVDGAEAVRAHRLSIQRDKPYDLICLDIMMPNMDGIEALRQIRDMEEEHNLPSEKQAKIIMVTAVIDQLQKKSARALRCDDYITKPINRQDLTKKLKAFKLI